MPTVPALNPSYRTRQALLEAGAVVAEEHGLAGLSVNRVTLTAGVAKGTFYVHFVDRAAFVDALHERFHDRVLQAVQAGTDGVPPGRERVVLGAEAYLDVCLANQAIKALALEARSDPVLGPRLSERHERFVAASIPSLRAMGWPDALAASQLLAAMINEVAIRELDAGHRLVAARRALARFLNG